MNDPEDAHALRRFFISDQEIARVKGKDKPLQIGLLQRPNKRRINNLAEIEAALKKKLPGCQTNLTEFSNATSLKDQAAWFATKDVIVAAHGAGLTNSIFVTKGTIVLQAYPDAFFWQSLDSLIEQSGGIALDWYSKGPHPVVAYVKAKETGAHNIGNEATITPPVHEVVDRILMALGKKPATRLALQQLRDTTMW